MTTPITSSISKIDNEEADTLLLRKKREQQQKRTPSPSLKEHVTATAANATQAACIASVSSAALVTQSTGASSFSKAQ